MENLPPPITTSVVAMPMASMKNSAPSVLFVPNQFIKKYSCMTLMMMPVMTTAMKKLQTRVAQPASTAIGPKNSMMITINPKNQGRPTVPREVVH